MGTLIFWQEYLGQCERLEFVWTEYLLIVGYQAELPCLCQHTSVRSF
jgi:hypothetical protein